MAYESAYSKLNEDQKTIVDLYVDGAVSMADAVREGGFAHFEGFSEHDVARRLLGSPKIQAAIKERVSIVHDKGVGSAMYLVRIYMDYMNTDHTQIYNDDSTIKPPKDWSPSLRKMVRSVKYDSVNGRIIEVKFESKLKTSELLGRTDLISAFEKENQTNETVVIIRDMTKKIERSVPVDVEAKRIG